MHYVQSLIIKSFSLGIPNQKN